jgi:YidC/Oxa1 family membrane protein insertase
MSTVLYPLEYAVAWIMVAWHSLFTAIGFSPSSGWTWALSIVGLVIVIRIILIPLFVKQIKASRGLQMVQPEIKKIQAKYKGKTDQESRQKMTQETMALYKETGTNPFASCLPIVLQAPIFFALFRVLNGIPKDNFSIGPLTNSLRLQADAATLLGSPISATFLNSDLMSTKVLAAVLIVLMSASTFTTQRQLMMKNMPASALDNPFAQQQKLLLYVLPLVFAVSGVNFPIGVLLYWLTTNVWSMGQQFYVIRRMPAPGSPAEKALQERRAKRGKAEPEIAASNGAAAITDSSVQDVVDAGPVPGQRIQPKKKPKRKRSGQKAAGPGGSASMSSPSSPAGPGGRSDPSGPSSSSGPSDQPGSSGPSGPSSGGSGPKGSSGSSGLGKTQSRFTET